MEETQTLFGRRVRQLRRFKNLTQAQLAEKIGLSVNYISQIEMGDARPTFMTLFKLAKALDTDLQMLFDFSQL